MPALAAALNDHIKRLARRQINASTRPTRRLTAQFRRDVAALKRDVAVLTKTIAYLETQEKRRAAQLPVAAEEARVGSSPKGSRVTGRSWAYRRQTTAGWWAPRGRACTSGSWASPVPAWLRSPS